MTVARKENRIKLIVFSTLFFIVTLFAIANFVFYKKSTGKMEEAIKAENAKLENRINKNRKLKRDIYNLKQKERTLASSGLDIKTAEKRINLVLNEIKRVKISIKDIQYHENFNDLLRVKLRVSLGGNKIENIKKIFIAKKILNLSIIKKELRVFDRKISGYKFKGNIVEFYYYEGSNS